MSLETALRRRGKSSHENGGEHFVRKDISIHQVITTILLLIIAGTLVYISTFMDDMVHLLKLISEAAANG
ncbi:hypothetical protein ACTHPH_05990 [Paenibacillus pasadenensis]